MQLEDYFEFLDPDAIRIKGHRIGIDNVIQYYLQGYSPEEIIDAYMLRLAKWREQRYQESLANPSPLMQRLRALKAQREQELLNS
ncbi:DUF433 domain-containing protein [Nostoc sp. XA010]|uniref:DUF433 domain-containing protein n=1 Tax=Nostoc sp. XA010 TaxID=2780407 RepID=UPI001E3A3A63|nr:DUF433 domain-containing protein [Nostoc sp. XA010]MCC5656800.1 DUF433 domain-containing protein [Nostoc sp. XA010]